MKRKILRGKSMVVLSAFVIIFIVLISMMIIKNITVPSNLGVLNGKLAPLPSSPNCISSQSSDSEKFVKSLPFKKNMAVTRHTLLKAVKDYGNTEIITDKGEYIHVVSKTGILRFRDDVEFYLDKRFKIIHIRSKSRVGYSDMGLNRKRYEKILELYNR